MSDIVERLRSGLVNTPDDRHIMMNAGHARELLAKIDSLRARLEDTQTCYEPEKCAADGTPAEAEITRLRERIAVLEEIVNDKEVTDGIRIISEWPDNRAKAWAEFEAAEALNSRERIVSAVKSLSSLTRDEE